MGDQPAPRPIVRISPQVVARDDLEHRLQSAREQVTLSRDSHERRPSDRNVSAIESAKLRADLLHSHWGTLSPPAIPATSGLRGRVSRLTKKVVRRSTAWNVEPRFEAQREFDAEVARFATDTIETIRLLREQIEDLQLANERLLRRLHAAEQAISPLTLSVEANVEG